MGNSKIIYKILPLLMVFTFAQADEYQEWLKSQSKDYTEYKKTIDEEFDAVLKQEWEEFQSMNNPSPYKVKKIIVPPKIKKIVKLPKKELVLSPKVVIKPIIKEKKVVKVNKPLIVYKNKEYAKFNFYSNSISMHYNKKDVYSFTQASSKNLANFWEFTSKTKWKELVKQIQVKSKELNLNGWAQYQLIYKLSKDIYRDENLANMSTWFFMTKLGYDTKVAYGNNKVYLLSTTQNTIYQVSFYTINSKKYYLMSPTGKASNNGKIYTYKGEYPKSTNKVSFMMNKAIKVQGKMQTRVLNFKYYNKKYTIKTEYSKDLIEFYKTFPQSDFTVYFDSKKSQYLSNSVLISLQKEIKGMSELEAANFILRFTQTAFKYKTDPDQFGYEKPMFPEEMLHYPYSDCEDRAVMYSYLIKNILGLHVVGIKYKGHLSTAVSFNSEVDGENFKYKNKIYVMADPTFINANVGMTMRQYKKAKFEIIE